MSDKPENPPAFPCTVTTGEPHTISRKTEDVPGLTMRDYFAATVIGPTVMATLRSGSPESVATDIFVAARAAYRIADAMLTERERGTDE